MPSDEVFKVRLSEAEKDALVARLDNAAAYLGAEKPPKLVFSNGDGTWDIGCMLEGERERLAFVLDLIYLGLEIPPPADHGMP